MNISGDSAWSAPRRPQPDKGCDGRFERAIWTTYLEISSRTKNMRSQDRVRLRETGSSRNLDGLLPGSERPCSMGVLHIFVSSDYPRLRWMLADENGRCERVRLTEHGLPGWGTTRVLCCRTGVLLPPLTAAWPPQPSLGSLL
jgi:hypothetical protein